MTFILGISCYYHDSAACLIKDGEIVAAAQEERFTRKKHDDSFPINAVNYCLNESGITVDDLEYVAFYDQPFLKFERILETYMAFAPRGLRSWMNVMPVWISEKFWMKHLIRKELNYKGKIYFTEHHQSHAASAFFPSPFGKAAILTMDGVGEWATTSYGVGEGNKIKIIKEIRFPHSLGLLYSAFTYYLGFRVNSGEYKVMGLAPYGQPLYTNLIKNKLIDIKPDGSFALDMKYFNYATGKTMTSQAFHNLFGLQPREPESKLTQKHMDIAKSLQEVIEEIVLKIANHVHKVTGQKYLVLAGGVALNCVANGRILREGPFDDIWVQPAAGDAGGSIGSAMYVWYQVLANKRTVVKPDMQKGSLLGPKFSTEEIRAFLQKRKIPYVQFADEELFKNVAKLIADEKVIGWFRGRMEFGPRALGSRSIIGDARSTKLQSVMNLKIKFRESFRPFAPAVLQEKASEYFEIGRPSPYMLLTAYLKKSHRLKVNSNDSKLSGLGLLKIHRSDVQAITHVDYSARLQTVNESTNKDFYKLIKAFENLTGCPMIINTSFNVRGEPIVCKPEEAYECFMCTDMDYLVLENFVLEKKNLPYFKKMNHKKR